MKSTGIIRKVDVMGRFVLPAEMRRKLDISVKDSLEIFTNESSIVLMKYEPACIFCGDINGIKNYKGKKICTACIKELKHL